MADASPPEGVHYAQIVALLRGMNVRARVVSSDSWEGIEVRQDSDRTYWGNSEEFLPRGIPWGWTTVAEDGKVQVGRTHIAPDAAPEDVALAIALVYADPESGPSL